LKLRGLKLVQDNIHDIGLFIGDPRQERTFYSEIPLLSLPTVLYHFKDLVLTIMGTMMIMGITDEHNFLPFVYDDEDQLA
jgi:hypothetical protein